MGKEFLWEEMEGGLPFPQLWMKPPSRSRTKNEIPIVIVRTIFKGVVAKTMELIGYKELGKVLVHAGKIIVS